MFFFFLPFFSYNPITSQSQRFNTDSAREMGALRAPLSMLSPLHHFRHFSSLYSRTLSPFSPPPLIRVLYFHSSRRSVAKITSMASNTAAAAASDGELISSDWFSVPELRLRDHRFTVPLDYSLHDINSSPKISVFAREVVAGNN